MVPPTRRRGTRNRVPPANQLTSLAQNRREQPAKKRAAKASTKSETSKYRGSIFENEVFSDDDAPPSEPEAEVMPRKRKKKAPSKIDSDSDSEFAQVPRKRKRKARGKTASDAEDDELLEEEERRKQHRKRGNAGSSRTAAPVRQRTPKRGTEAKKSNSKPAAQPLRSSLRIKSLRERNLEANHENRGEAANSGKSVAQDEDLDSDSEDFDAIPLSARKPSKSKEKDGKAVSRRSRGIKKSTSPKRSRKSKIEKDSDSDSTGDAVFGTQDSNVSEPLKLTIKPLKVRKKRRAPTEEKLVEYEMSRKRLTEDELSNIRVAFIKWYPTPPSNLQAQSRYEQQYGRPMPKKMIDGLWKNELQPWSDRWWKFYQHFNDVVREKKMEKRPDKEPTLLKSELAAWAKKFFDENGEAKIPFVPKKSDSSHPTAGNEADSAGSSSRKIGAAESSSAPLGATNPSPDDTAGTTGTSRNMAGTPGPARNVTAVKQPAPDSSSNSNNATESADQSNDRIVHEVSSPSQGNNPKKNFTKLKKTKKAEKRLVAIPLSELNSKKPYFFASGNNSSGNDNSLSLAAVPAAIDEAPSAKTSAPLLRSMPHNEINAQIANSKKLAVPTKAKSAGNAPLLRSVPTSEIGRNPSPSSPASSDAAPAADSSPALLRSKPQHAIDALSSKTNGRFVHSVSVPTTKAPSGFSALMLRSEPISGNAVGTAASVAGSIDEVPSARAKPASLPTMSQQTVKVCSADTSVQPPTVQAVSVVHIPLLRSIPISQIQASVITPRSGDARQVSEGTGRRAPSSSTGSGTDSASK